MEYQLLDTPEISTDTLGNVCCYKWFSTIVKLLAVILDFTCESLTLYNNQRDLRIYDNNPFINITSGNHIFTTTVDIDAFKNSFISFSTFFGLNIFIVISVVFIQCRRVWKGKKPYPFLWLPIAVLIEMPLLVSVASMMKARGIIDWNEQFWDLLLHVVFILQIPIQMVLDVWSLSKKSNIHFFVSFLSSLLCLVIACVLYAPVAITMVGFEALLTIPNKDIGDIAITADAENIVLFLVNFGRIGAWSWLVFFACFILLYRTRRFWMSLE